MTDEARLSQLRDAGRAAGLVDLDLVHLAHETVPVDVAIKELKLRYPGAFPKPFDARTATKAECDAWWRQHMEAHDPTARRNAELAEAITKAGDVRDMPEAEYRALCRRIGLR